jgi:hypothetical protein
MQAFRFTTLKGLIRHKSRCPGLVLVRDRGVEAVAAIINVVRRLCQINTSSMDKTKPGSGERSLLAGQWLEGHD